MLPENMPGGGRGRLHTPVSFPAPPTVQPARNRPPHGERLLSCWDVLYISAELGAQARSHPASELGNWALRQGRAL